METLITHLPTAIFMIFAAIGGAILPKQIKIAKENKHQLLALIVQLITLIVAAYMSYGFHSGYIQGLVEHLSPYWSVGGIIFALISFIGIIYFLGSYWGTFGPFVTGISLGYFFGALLWDQQYASHTVISVIIFVFFLAIGTITSKRYKIETEE